MIVDQANSSRDRRDCAPGFGPPTTSTTRSIVSRALFSPIFMSANECAQVGSRDVEWLADLLEKHHLHTPSDFQLSHSFDLIRGGEFFLVVVPESDQRNPTAPQAAAQACNEAGIALNVALTDSLGQQQVCI